MSLINNWIYNHNTPYSRVTCILKAYLNCNGWKGCIKLWYELWKYHNNRYIYINLTGIVRKHIKIRGRCEKGNHTTCGYSNIKHDSRSDIHLCAWTWCSWSSYSDCFKWTCRFNYTCLLGDD